MLSTDRTVSAVFRWAHTPRPRPLTPCMLPACRTLKPAPTLRAALRGDRAALSTSEATSLQQRLRDFEVERDASTELARICTHRSRRLLARMQALKKYAQERREAGDLTAVRSTLKTRLQVQEVLLKTIDRGRNNSALASKLETIIGSLQCGLDDLGPAAGLGERLWPGSTSRQQAAQTATAEPRASPRGPYARTGRQQGSLQPSLGPASGSRATEGSDKAPVRPWRGCKDAGPEVSELLGGSGLMLLAIERDALREDRRRDGGADEGRLLSAAEGGPPAGAGDKESIGRGGAWRAGAGEGTRQASWVGVPGSAGPAGPSASKKLPGQGGDRKSLEEGFSESEDEPAAVGAGAGPRWSWPEVRAKLRGLLERLASAKGDSFALTDVPGRNSKQYKTADLDEVLTLLRNCLEV